MAKAPPPPIHGTRMDAGYFTSVGGRHVSERHLKIPTTTWEHGHPIGIVFHYTAGCSSDLSGVYLSNGFGGASFSVDRDGAILEYAPVDVATWHAFEASRVYVGIEHTALPGTCELTDAQLEASAVLVASIVRHVRRRFGFEIPLRKIVGPALVAGFHDHRDGTIQTWNPNGHTDHLYVWSWKRYLGQVRKASA